MLGIDFTECNKFVLSFRFDSCTLDYSIFSGAKIPKTHFLKCSLKEVDFTDANIASSVFTQSDLTDATFFNTTLEKADFRNAFNFNIDPEHNKLKKAKFSALQLEGLLCKYQLDIDNNV
jgi:uncharacterized protein YjbI with pentapeptide repeats